MIYLNKLLFFILLFFCLSLYAKNPIAVVKTSEGSFKFELFCKETPLTVSSFYRLSTGQKKWLDTRNKTIYKTPYYDSLTIHRVVRNFVVQMGCYIGNSKSDPGFAVTDEIYNGEEVHGKIVDEIMARRVMEEIIIPFIKNKRDKLLGNVEIVELFKECSIKKSSQPLMKHPIEYYIKVTGFKGKFTQKTTVKSFMKYGSVALANSGAPSSGGAQFFIVTNRNGAPKMDGKFTIFGQIIEGMDVINKIENVKTDKNYKPIPNIYILGINFIDPDHKLH